ncbi:class IV adenylate cyclase [Salinilacihabitans rarus]|uniref:class IV adenylate cyclase n=1 Tax=Salinilacihabitans rarus TaxID=2961596 RepID=UPI0020C858D9|nr:class IV adenylate cyclase [Salinilacihabitans rarus]
MYEVELKVPADPDRVRDRLDELGADRRGTVVQEDTYYDAPHRSFPETDEALRIREEVAVDEEGADPETRVTYKGPLVDDATKTREEVETRVADGEKLATILGHLGFEPAATVRKERERYGLDGYAVVVDSVDGVGEFVEVEAAAEADDLDAVREGAAAVLERLGLDPADGIRTSYLELSLAE